MELEDTMASLRLNDPLKSPESAQIPAPIESPCIEEPRRSMRIKSRKDYTEKRRVYTKPTKLKEDTIHLRDYYLDKNMKRLSPSLETIYEDNSDEKCLRKNNKISITRTTKRRKLKVKSVTAQQRLINKEKLSLAYLLEKLEKIDE